MHIEIQESEHDAERGVTNPMLEVLISITNKPKQGPVSFVVYVPIDCTVYIAPESTHPHGAVIIER